MIFALPILIQSGLQQPASLLLQGGRLIKQMLISVCSPKTIVLKGKTREKNVENNKKYFRIL